MNDFTDHRETVLSWLNDAYAMERSAEKHLEQQLQALAGADASDYPAPIYDKLRSRLEETRQQQRDIQRLIEDKGGDVSRLRNASAWLGGMFSGRVGSLHDDGAVKALAGNYALACSEVQAYLILEAAGEELDDEDIRRLARNHLKQEQDMASWMEDILPELVGWYFTPVVERAEYWEGFDEFFDAEAEAGMAEIEDMDEGMEMDEEMEEVELARGEAGKEAHRAREEQEKEAAAPPTRGALPS